MIVLKSLAREFGVEPYKLRQILRAKFGKRRSWRWPDDQDASYVQTNMFLCERFGKTTSVSPKSSAITPSPSKGTSRKLNGAASTPRKSSR